VWVGGNSTLPGYWFGSKLPGNTQFPEKYSALFDLDNDYVSCDPDDGQQDTAAFEFLGDLYLCKNRKIFCLVGGKKENSPPLRVSYHIGVAFPNSVAFGIVPETGEPAVFFVSESGPARLRAGGKVELMHEFAIAELWPDGGGIITTEDEETTVYSRNLVKGAFFRDTYWLMFGDSDDVLNEFEVFKMFGCHHAIDGNAFGAFKVEFNALLEPFQLVVFSNATAYLMSQKSVSGAWRKRIGRFLDPATWHDSYLEDAGIDLFHLKAKPRPIFNSEYRDTFATLEKIILRVKFSDDEGLSVIVYADEARDSVVCVYSQFRNSGITVVGVEGYRKTIHITVDEGFYGTSFSLLIDKTVPEGYGSASPVELFSPEIISRPFSRSEEFTSPSGSLTSPVFVRDANAAVEVIV
jgi:hypothetical protein